MSKMMHKEYTDMTVSGRGVRAIGHIYKHIHDITGKKRVVHERDTSQERVQR